MPRTVVNLSREERLYGDLRPDLYRLNFQTFCSEVSVAHSHDDGQLEQTLARRCDHDPLCCGAKSRRKKHVQGHYLE